jgi:hypothetical protein
MRYSNAFEITAMTLLWAAALIWYDIAFNQHLFRPPMADITHFSSPQVNLWIQHVGCTGKADDTMQALRALSWLDQVELTGRTGTPGAGTEAHTNRPAAVQCDIGVLAHVRQVEQADFMEIYNALRPLDVVPTTVEFGGIPHFALQAKVANLSCEACDEAATEVLKRAAANAMAPRKDPKFGETFKWRDSEQVDLKDQTVTAFVRFNNPAHINEMVWALTQAGFPPWSIHIVIEEKGTTAHREKGATAHH